MNKDKVSYYFIKEKKLLILITVSGLIYNIGMATIPWFEGQMVQNLSDIISGIKTADIMWITVLAYLVSVLVIQGSRYFKRLYVRRFANRINKSMRLTVYENLLRKNRNETDGAGDLMTRIISDVDACAEGMRKFLTEIFDTGVMMISYVVMLIIYDYKLTLMVMIFPPLAYLMAERLKKAVTDSVSKSRKSMAALNEATLDRTGNAITYRVYGEETNRNIIYEQYLDDYERKARKASVYENAMQPIYQVISMIGTVLIIIFGAANVMNRGFTLWNIAAFTAYFSCYQKLAVKSSKAAKLFNAVHKAEVSWKRIVPYLKETRLNDHETLIDDELRFDNVTVCFKEGTPLLRNVSFRANKGEIIGVTGPVASGKTVLMRLLTGEYPYEGVISSGSYIFDNSGRSYETGIGYMGHQPELLNGSIRDNITMGKDGDISEVLKDVCMDVDIRSFENGEDTLIGDNGVRLSGGQKSRIALARTLYHAGSLMILDDPFASVDMKTENEIFHNLRKYQDNRIIFVISHRLSAFEEMDRILWVDNGQVIISDHKILMKTNEDYRYLYETQTGGDIHETSGN